jgi:hypothetical protein
MIDENRVSELVDDVLTRVSSAIHDAHGGAVVR